MGRIAYSAAQKAEAVALAVVIGAERASEELGPQAHTIRGWMARAGKAPADAIVSDEWSAIGARAMARAHRLLDTGKVNGTQALTMAAIALRNASTVKEAPPDSAATAHDAFADWLGGDELALDTDTSADAIGSLFTELMRRANEEPDQPHRVAMLAWFSGRPEPVAGDVLLWAQGQTQAILAEHGSLGDLHEWRTARDIASRQAVADQLAANRAVAEATRRAAMDAETRAILEEAERWLAVNR